MTIRSVDEAELRKIVKDSFGPQRARGGVRRLKSSEAVVYKGLTIPPRAEVFFPEDSKRAIVFIGDPGGSVIDINPGVVNVKRRNGEAVNHNVARGTKQLSIMGRKLGFS